jgi:hypothetical protein
VDLGDVGAAQSMPRFTRGDGEQRPTRRRAVTGGATSLHTAAADLLPSPLLLIFFLNPVEQGPAALRRLPRRGHKRARRRDQLLPWRWRKQSTGRPWLWASPSRCRRRSSRSRAQDGTPPRPSSLVCSRAHWLGSGRAILGVGGVSAW